MLGLSKGQVIFLIVFLILLVAIPVSVVLVRSNAINLIPKAEESRPVKLNTAGSDTFQSLKDLIAAKPSNPPPEGSTVLSLAVTLEGRKNLGQSDELFVGIAETEAAPPTYLATKTITTDKEGKVTTALSGLFPGKTYYLYIKGSQHIAASRSFVLKTGINDLSADKVLLAVGDVNADNVIDKFDQSIIQDSFGSVPGGTAWNPLADLNHDLIVNNADLSLIAQNFGKVGSGGAWTSRAATASARTTP